MKLDQLFSVMEKVGSLSFNSKRERDGLLKIAQGMMIDPAMAQMAAQSGMPPMVDPATMSAQPMAAGPAPMGQPPMDITQPIAPEEAMVGEAITNSDVESLVKIINIITSLKSKYDAMKKEQMDLLKAQSGEIPGGGVVPPGA